MSECQQHISDAIENLEQAQKATDSMMIKRELGGVCALLGAIMTMEGKC